MAYDFQKLADVELLEEVPDGASAFVAVDGTVKRVPGSGLGGGVGIATAILRLASESNASTKAVARAASIPVENLPITCDNYTYEQARAVLAAGDPFTAMIFMSEGNILGWKNCSQVALFDNYIVMVFINDKEQDIYWNSDGFFNREPKNSNP